MLAKRERRRIRDEKFRGEIFLSLCIFLRPPNRREKEKTLGNFTWWLKIYTCPLDFLSQVTVTFVSRNPSPSPSLSLQCWPSSSHARNVARRRYPRVCENFVYLARDERETRENEREKHSLARNFHLLE